VNTLDGDGPVPGGTIGPGQWRASCQDPRPGTGPRNLEASPGGQTPWRNGPVLVDDRPGRSPVEEVHDRPGRTCQDRATRPRLAASPGRLREPREASCPESLGRGGPWSWRGPVGDPRAGSGLADQRSAGVGRGWSMLK